MKKTILYALIAAGCIAGTSAIPVQAAEVNSDCTLTGQNANVKVYTLDQGELKQVDGSKIDLSMIETLQTDCPDTNTPQTSAPATSAPQTNTPETNAPETTAPETSAPVTSAPATSAPETTVPDTGTPETGTEAKSYAEQVVSLVNAERAKAGLNALTLDNQIASAALVRAKEIEKSFSHTRPDGRSFNTVLIDNGISYRGAGENIAWGQATPEEVMNGWMNSEGHRANILNAKFTKIGVGFYKNASGRNHWTQLFTY